MYFISSWTCTKISKNLFVKIVHPGGRVEIHDQPILASDVLIHNPKCCVAHHTVFHHPYAVVSPTTTLALGQKYYIIPIYTIRKLQLQYSLSQSQKLGVQSSGLEQKIGKKDGDFSKMEYSSRWLMRINKNGHYKVKNGEKVCLKNSEKERVSSIKTRALSLKSFDHWQPGLESIIEE